MLSEIFDWLEDAIKRSRELTAELEALKKRLKKDPTFSDSESADADKVIGKARGDG